MGVSLSVVIPVRDGSEQLRSCLQAIRASTAKSYEIIVIDDCSSKEIPKCIATEFGVKLVRLVKPSGPAVARNTGAHLALSDIVVFIDADVCVHADSLQRIHDNFDADPELDAVFGSYQERAGADNFISVYKNFQHHFVHQTSRPDAWTFWSGCGAVRRHVFLAHGGFRPSYRRPAVEDIEFGMRLFSSGGKLRLDKSIQAAHMKRWGFLSLIRTEVGSRAAPWAELLLERHQMPDDLNLRWGQRLSAVLAFISVIVLIGGYLWLGLMFLAPFTAVACLTLSSYWVDWLRVAGSGRGAVLTVCGFSLALALTGIHAKYLLMAASVAIGYALVLIRARLRGLADRQGSRLDRITFAYFVLATIWIVGNSSGRCLLGFAIALVAALIWLNREFYGFLRLRWGPLNALSATLFHLTYYLCCILGFGIAITRHAVASQRIAHKGESAS